MKRWVIFVKFRGVRFNWFDHEIIHQQFIHEFVFCSYGQSLFSELDNDISVIFTFGTSHPKHCRNNNGQKKESIQYGHHARIKEMDSPTNQLVEFNRNDKNDLRIA
jgi:hypothetical protein